MSTAEKSPLPTVREQRPTILLVEDEPPILIALSDFLKENGFATLEAADAVKAIQIIKSNPIGIDLVFSDVKMPGDMDGFGLAMWVRTNRPKLPIILCSGDAKKLDAVEQLGPEVPFLAKPYDLKLLVAQIRQSLQPSSN